LRIGAGYDIHPLKPGRKLIIGGVRIPHGLGLDGHSDADVLTHAVIDALLGAAALGNIGDHFPADDPRYKDASSLDLLATASDVLKKAGYRVVNIAAAPERDGGQHRQAHRCRPRHGERQGDVA
jgi:2-C-methyl-D-erythritol 2,4-cyclodiphosphate synthase